MSTNTLRRLALGLSIPSVVAGFAFLTGCSSAAGTNSADSEELTGANEGGAAITASYPAGSVLAATANLNLRSGPSTSKSVLHVIPNGANVTLLASHPQNGFYNVKHNGTSGWAYGKYLTVVSQPAPSDPGNGGSDGSDGSGGSSSSPPPASTPRDAAIARAKEGVGFSYWWGHGRFDPAGATSENAGTCSGSCPNCSHSGSYGGDCSGFVGHVWQVPSSNTDMSVDEHPYSTASFVSDTSLWSTVDRGSVMQVDAFVYHSGGAGHIFLYDSGDGWGSLYAYECKGCAAGCVYDLRTASSAYHAIRRTGY